MEEAVVPIRQDDGAFGGVCIDEGRVATAEGPARFEGQQRLRVCQRRRRRRRRP